MSNSLQPDGLQHVRLPCPSLSLWICSNSCPLSQWCHPTISSSVAPSPCHPQFSPASGSFPESALCIRWTKDWSFCFSISPSNVYSGLISFRIDSFDLLNVQGTWVFSSYTVQKHQFFDAQPSLCSNSHIHTWLVEKP